MRARCQLFRSSFKSWEALCEEASEFATSVGPEQVISIATALGDDAGQGVIFVWYWDRGDRGPVRPGS